MVGSNTATRRERREDQTRRNRRRIFRVVLLVVLLLLGWLGYSVGGALLNPSYGPTAGSRLAEWARLHDLSGVVTWGENEWYSHHPPPVGGKPPAGAIKNPNRSAESVQTATTHLPSPKPIVPFASPAIAGEGKWYPVGRRVDGVPTVYVTTLRPDAVHTSYVVGVAWMDTKLLRATLYSGSLSPGGGPYQNTAPVPPHSAETLVAAFNSGFLMDNANGGYYTDGKAVDPLVRGAASFVIYNNGSVNIGAWDSNVKMSSDVMSVRQNVDLLVDHGKPVPGLIAADQDQWGWVVGNSIYVWRSGVGITADGALVYVGGPGLDITDLANILVRAGAVRAMELDINSAWVNFSYYTPESPKGLAGPANGTELLSAMAGSPSRYFESWWERDFFTMSAVYPPPRKPPGRKGV
jgi:hypothetical protein